MKRRAFLAGAVAAQAAGPAPVRLPKKVRVVMVGLDAHPGEVLNPSLAHPSIEVTALFDEDPATAERYKQNPKLRQARVYTDYREMLDKEKPDVAGVCNSNGGRADAVIACLERNIHTAAEKPLAIERASFNRVVTAVKNSKAKLTMLLPMRFNSVYLAMKKVVDSGEIGEVIQIGAQKSYKTSKRPAWFYKRATYGGTIPWIGIHMVDLMRWSSGRDFTEVFSYQNKIGFPDTGDIENVTGSVFRMDNGGVAVLRMDYLRTQTAPTHGDDRLRLAGTKGIVEYMAATGVTLMSATRKPEKLERLPEERSLFSEFLDHIYNGAPEPISWQDIYRDCHIVIAARDGAEEGRIVKL
jgi:predicted dehydrogenase